MSRAAVILARGGSKRIPRKNLRLFRGRPLLTYAVDASIASGVFDEIIVSTDDDEVAGVARDAGASVPFLRPSELSDDQATTDAAMWHAVEVLTEHLPELTAACCIYPSPFVAAPDLRDGLALLENTGCDGVVPVVRYDFPVEQAMRVVDGRVVPVDAEAMDMRSQDLPPAFHDAGLFYWTRVDSFRRSRALLVGDIRPLELPAARYQDINTMDDWAIAELKYDLVRDTEPDR